MPGRIRRFTISSLILLFAACTQGQAGKSSEHRRFETVVAKLVKAYNADDAAGFYSHFSESLQAKVPVDAIVFEFQQGKANFGKIVRVDSLSVLDPNEALVKLVFEKAGRDLHVWLNETDQIDWLEYKERGESDSTTSDAAANIRLLDVSKLEELKEIFQKDSGSVRLIALLAPT